MSDSEHRNKQIGETVDTTKAIMAIRDERFRQIGKEGWSVEHDDDHDDESLAAAAASYAWPYRLEIDGGGITTVFAKESEDYYYTPLCWPISWDCDWWKPTDRRRDLIKAGALIVAEIERLDRAKAKAAS